MSEARIAEPSARAQLDEIADDVSCGATDPSDLVAKAMELIDEDRTERQRSDELLVQAHNELCDALDVRHRPLLDVIQHAAVVRAERDRLAEQVKRVRDLHTPDENGECTACDESFDPCSTIRALDGTETGR